MPAFDDFLHHVFKGFELAGGQVVGEAGNIDFKQPRMAAYLTQLEQRVQNGHLTFGKAFLVHVGQHLVAQLAGHGRIELGLSLLECAAGDAFHLGRQIPGHFGFCTAQDEGPDPGAQVFKRLGIAVLDGLDDSALEGMLAAEEARHEELEKRP